MAAVILGNRSPVTFTATAKDSVTNMSGSFTASIAVRNVLNGIFGVTSYMTGLTPDQAITQWGGPTAVNRPVQGLKVYYQQSDGTGSTTFFPLTVDSNVQACLDNNLTCFLCYKPNYTSLTPTSAPYNADYQALQASLQALKNAGVKAKVILYQEIEHVGLTATQYKAALAYYNGAIQAVYPGSLLHDAAGSYSGQWANFFPGTLVNGCGVDFYSTIYANGVVLDPLIQLCQNAGIPFNGALEMGVSIGAQQIPDPTVTTAYLNYLIGVARAIIASGNQPYFMWYQQQNLNVNNLIPGNASYLVPQLQLLSDVIGGVVA